MGRIYVSSAQVKYPLLNASENPAQRLTHVDINRIAEYKSTTYELRLY
jgi:hypothetical protein